MVEIDGEIHMVEFVVEMRGAWGNTVKLDEGNNLHGRADTGVHLRSSSILELYS